MDMLHLSKSRSSTTQPMSDNTYLEYDDENQGEIRKNTQI